VCCKEASADALDARRLALLARLAWPKSGVNASAGHRRARWTRGRANAACILVAVASDAIRPASRRLATL